MNYLRTVISLARLNSREWIRLKFFHIVIFFGVLLIIFSHMLSTLTFSVQERLLYDFALGSLEISLIMIASLIGTHAIQREVDRKTMFVLLARPIPRNSIVIGAWGSILILSLLFTAGFLVSFLATSGHSVPMYGVFVSAFTTLLKTMVITSVALAFGLLVRPILALVATICYWILCYSMNDIEFFVNKIESVEIQSTFEVLKNLFPEFYTYNWKSYYYVQNVPTGGEILWSSLHSMSWMCIWLLIACVVFRRKEIV